MNPEKRAIFKDIQKDSLEIIKWKTGNVSFKTRTKDDMAFVALTPKQIKSLMKVIE